MKHKSLQRELPVLGDVFNLAGETGVDPVRVLMDAAREARDRELAREFEQKMQRKLADCPGFIGADAPSGPSCSGKVMIDPRLTMEAVAWLKKRYHVSENIELSTGLGLCIEVKPRAVGRCMGKRPRVSFAKPEQFELRLS